MKGLGITSDILAGLAHIFEADLIIPEHALPLPE